MSKSQCTNQASQPGESHGPGQSISHNVVFTTNMKNIQLELLKQQTSSEATSDSGFAYAEGKPMGCDL